MPKTEPKSIDKLTYEEAFAELEKIVESLESGERTLDESLMLFERGQALTKHCSSLLEKAELKVKQVTGESLTDFAEEA